MHKKDGIGYWRVIWSVEHESSLDKLDKEFSRTWQVFGFIALVLSLILFCIGGTYTGIAFPIGILSQIGIWLPIYCYWQEDKWERDR